MSTLIEDSDRLRRRLGQSLSFVESGCLEWTGHLTNGGYGYFTVAGQRYAAHRVSYQLHVGQIPPGFEVDHLCRNRACSNPDHLEAVTGAENRRRQGLAVTHCRNGHEYTDENTLRTKHGRYCRECKRERGRAAWRKANPVVRGSGPRKPCLRGHEPTETNIYTAPDGAKQCRACHRERAAIYRERRRACQG